MPTATYPSVPDARVGRRDYPVAIDASPLHTAAIQRAVDACAADGGGRVVLGTGTYRSGTIVLRSNVTLHLEKDAVLLGSADIGDYARNDKPLNFALGGGVPSGLVFAQDATDIAVTGEGTIDGNGRSYCAKRAEKIDWVEEKKAFGLWIPGFDNQSGARPQATVLLVGCRGVRLSGVRLVNSPSWMAHLLACDDVQVSGIVIRGLIDGSNTDGLDLDSCSDVCVEDCDIETGDDAIALKTSNCWNLLRPSRRIAVRRCRLASTTHGFTIGTNTQHDFEDITLADSTIEGVAGHRVLTGVGLDMVDGARMRGVRISGVTIDDAIAPLHVRLGNVGRGQVVLEPGEIRDIALEKILIRRAGGNCLLAGLPGHPLRGVTVRELSLEFVDRVDPTQILRTAPEFAGEFPPNPAWRLLPAYGFFCRHIDGLELADVAIRTMVPESRPAVALQDVVNFNGRDLCAAEGV